MAVKTVLTIAGSDCSGGAGIQADIKTIEAHGLYAMSAITALTAQNTTGVYGIHEVPPEFVKQQIDCVFQDIRPDAVKIGMVQSGAVIEVIARKLIEYGAQNVVVDPVMVATSGGKLLLEGAVRALIDLLLPLGALITPNIPEAEALSGLAIVDRAGMEAAAARMAQNLPGAVLVKGGHLRGEAADLLYCQGRAQWFAAERIETKNTHGTGCTLSSAIACNLAEGRGLEKSVSRAKEYLTGALRDGLDLGRGSGPLNHAYRIPAWD